MTDNPGLYNLALPDVTLPTEPTEDRLEYRLLGQPGGGYPPYDFTACTPEDIATICRLWVSVHRDWADTTLLVRRVQTRASEWREL